MKNGYNYFLPSLMAVLVLSLTSCKECADQTFSREAREFTKKNCPMQVNPTTRLDSMTYDVPTHTVGYHYTTDDSLKIRLVKSQLLNGIKNATTIRTYKDEGCNFRYCYRANNGVVVADIIIRAEEYGTKSPSH